MSNVRPMKDVLWEAQGGMCWICGHRMVLGGRQHGRIATFDHVFPKSKFRAMGDVGIVLLAHRDCNARRGDPMPSDDELRVLVRIWRSVDREWLRVTLSYIAKNIAAVRLQTARAELLTLYAGENDAA